jgi:hypothetical protein
MPSAVVANNIRMHGYQLKITDPDGIAKTMTWDIVWDTTSSQYTPFVPDIPGTYTVIARFAGSESYWPSNSETSFSVDAAAPTPSPYPEVALPPTELYIASAAAAIIIVVAVVGALILLAIRRK